MEALNVVEIFTSIEGEGLLIGTPTLFVRLAGCSVGCSWCDTKYAQNTSKSTPRTPEDICNETLMKTAPLKIKRISITGGNPVESDADALIDLILKLQNNQYTINLEHPGIFLDLPKEMRILSSLTLADSLSIDIKPPSANVKANAMVFKDNVALLSKTTRVYIKSVFDTLEDIVFLQSFLRNLPGTCAGFSIQPCIGVGRTHTNSAKTLKDNWGIIANLLGAYNGRLIPQVHKFLNME